MPRKRMIDPSIWTDEGMAELTPRQQLLYIGLFSNADDDGRLNGSAAAIRLMLPGVYGGAPKMEVDTDLAAVLREMRQIVAYEADGRRYLAIRKFRVWQKVDHPTASMLPAPPEDSSAVAEPSASTHRTLAEGSGITRASLIRLEEEKLVEENKPPAADAAPPSAILKPNRQAEVVEAIEAEHVPLTFTPRDGAAIKKCAAPPPKIAAAYCAAYRGEWGNDWLRDNLSVHEVINRLAGYEPGRARTPNSRGYHSLSNQGEAWPSKPDDPPLNPGFETDYYDANGTRRATPIGEQ